MIPKDPVMLLSYVNTQLRDYYDSLDDFLKDKELGLQRSIGSRKSRRRSYHSYMYGTGGGAVDGFSVYSSPDLANWKAEGQVFRGNIPGSWGVANFWAPEVFRTSEIPGYTCLC